MRHNRMTVADLRAAKGQRVLSMLYVETLEQAAAAGVDVLSITAPLWTPAMREAGRYPGPEHDLGVDEAEFAGFLKGMGNG